jgi:CubicO group peptidase (beta-lactamase class C family)
VIRDDFVLPDDYATNHVTFEDALSHRTGMPRHDMSYGGGNFTVRDLVRSLRYLPLTTELRTEFQYCNMMFVAVSHAIETITGVWLGKFFQKYVWTPLGMSSTFFSLRDAQDAETAGKVTLARGYYYDNFTNELVPVPWPDMPESSGAGDIISNVIDYAKYLRAMLNEDVRLLSKDGFEELRKSRSIANPGRGQIFTGPQTYTLGWVRETYRGFDIFAHDGAVSGFGATMAYVPALDFGVAVMSNVYLYGNGAGMMLAFSLIDDVLKVPEYERLDFAEHFFAGMRKEEQDWNNARDRLFPDAPKQSIPPTLAFLEYTGQYRHPAYQSITLELAPEMSQSNSATPPVFTAEVYNRTFAHALFFEHVSGEYFLVRNYFLVDQQLPLFDPVEVYKAEFRIGASGQVEQLGITYEPKMGDEMIWFEKVA